MNAWEQLSVSNLASSTWFFPINWTGKRWQIAFPFRYSIFFKLCQRFCWFSFSIDYWILVTFPRPSSTHSPPNKGQLFPKRSVSNPKVLEDKGLAQIWFDGLPGHQIFCFNIYIYIYLEAAVLSGDGPNQDWLNQWQGKTYLHFAK